MSDKMRERVQDLETVIHLLLDHIDYLGHACSVTEMVGAVLPREILIQAREAVGKQS